jgi:hypothetical protein
MKRELFEGRFHVAEATDPLPQTQAQQTLAHAMRRSAPNLDQLT